jgi:hypothetical protein
MKKLAINLAGAPFFLATALYMPQAMAFKIPVMASPENCQYGRANDDGSYEQVSGTYLEYADILIANQISALNGDAKSISFSSGDLDDYKSALELARDFLTYGREIFHQDDFYFQYNGVVYGGKVGKEPNNRPFYDEDFYNFLSQENPFFDGNPELNDQEMSREVETGYQEQQASSDSLQKYADSINKAIKKLNYLRIEGPYHVLRNSSMRFKGNFGQQYSYVSFYNDETGYVGRDKTNFEANAYKHMTLSAHGPAIVWITGDGMCSAKSVVVQNPPEISVKYHAPTRKLDITYYADNRYSKAAAAKQDIKLTLTNGSTSYYYNIPAIGDGKVVSSSATPVTIEKQNDGRYMAKFSLVLPHLQSMNAIVQAHAIIDDGTYSASDSFFLPAMVVNNPQPVSGTREACGRAGKPYPCYL